MADVFISYAREDRARAEQIARGLQAMGLDVFWDSEIPPGKTWADYIEEKLAQCKAMVVLWSEHSTKSQWVREEARMGRDKGNMIPVMIDNSQAPFGFGEVQAADLSTWRGENTHAGWVRFANAVDGAVRGPNASPRPIPAAAPAARTFTATESATGEASALSPVGYIAKCLRMYFNGNGRARRLEYGWFLLFQFVCLVVALMIDGSIFGFNMDSQPNMYLATWGLLALTAPGISVTARRAHDLGITGWAAAIAIIPYIGWIVALILLFAPGKRGENKYGPDPKAA